MRPLTAAILLTLSLAAIVLFLLSPATAAPATPPVADAASGVSDAASPDPATASGATPSAATASAATASVATPSEEPASVAAPTGVTPDAGPQYVAPSMSAAAVRLFVGLAGVGLAMAGSLAAYRWVMRRRSGAERAGLERRYRPQVLSRTYLGAKESLCVVEVGHERFLIATTPTGVSLLGRLERGESPEAEIAEPSASDFGRALRTATSMAMTVPPTVKPVPPTVTPVRPADDTELLAALARSRDRLARLTEVSALGDLRA